MARVSCDSAPSPPMLTTDTSSPAAATPRWTKPPDAAVLHRDVAGGADQVGLLEAAAPHVGGVVGEAEVGPVQLHAPHALRHHLPHRQAVVDLLEHEAGEHGEDLQLDAVAPLVHRVEQARVGQAIAVLLGADALLAVGGAGAVVGPVDGVARVVAAVRAHQDAAPLGEARDPEGPEEGVEQARVVGVLDVLHVELPVVRQGLGEAAHDPHRAAQHAPDPPEDLRAQVLLDRRGLGREAREHEAVERGGAQLARPVVRLAERLRHPAAAVAALLERDADQAAPQVVGPGVIDALEVAARRAPVVERDQRAAMGAAILEGVDLARPRPAPR